MGKIIRNGIEFCGTSDTADNIIYDNTSSGLEATTVQEAVDEIHSQVNDSLSGFYMEEMKEITLPFTATKKCFLFVKVSTNSSTGYVYLDSAIFGNNYIDVCVPNLGGGSMKFCYPIKNGDTITLNKKTGLSVLNYYVIE